MLICAPMNMSYESNDTQTRKYIYARSLYFCLLFFCREFILQNFLCYTLRNLILGSALPLIPGSHVET
jgi:hypothetical protein